MSSLSNPSPNKTSFRIEWLELQKLAVPLALTQFGNLALALVDVGLIGRVGETELAAASIGNGIFFTLTIFGVGVLLSLEPFLNQHLGANQPELALERLGQGISLAVGVSLAMSIAIVGVTSLVPFANVPAEVVGPVRDYVFWRLPSLLPFYLLAVSRSWLQATRRTSSLVWGVVLANVFNLLLGIVLCPGLPVSWLEQPWMNAFTSNIPLAKMALNEDSFLFTGLGLMGAGLTTTLATIVLLVVSVWPIRKEIFAAYRASNFQWKALQQLLFLGIPIGCQLSLEGLSFSLVSVWMGPYGTAWMGGHQIAITWASASFALSLGISQAATVRVGHAIGENNARKALLAGRAAFSMGLCVMTCGAFLFLGFAEELARMMTEGESTVQAALVLLQIAAVFQLSDGIQVVGAGALRGAGDVKPVLIANAVGHYALGLPLGLFLAHTMHAKGLWWGLALGLSVVAVSLAFRFEWLLRRPLKSLTQPTSFSPH